MTRKLIAIALLAIASIASLAAFANRGNGGAVRGAAARAGMIIQNSTTSRSYVQDGLISMWDGIDNVGFGKHSANTAVWYNLVDSSKNFGVDSSKVKVRSDCMYHVPHATASATGLTSSFYFNDLVTIEIVARHYEGVAYLFTQANGGNVGSLPTKHMLVNSSYVSLMKNTSSSFICYSASTATGVKYQISAVYGNNSVSAAYKNCVRLNVGGSMGQNAGGEFVLFGRLSDMDWESYETEIYCCRIYNRALTAAEIAHNYSVDKRRFNLP